MFSSSALTYTHSHSLCLIPSCCGCPCPFFCLSFFLYSFLFFLLLLSFPPFSQFSLIVSSLTSTALVLVLICFVSFSLSFSFTFAFRSPLVLHSLLSPHPQSNIRSPLLFTLLSPLVFSFFPFPSVLPSLFSFITSHFFSSPHHLISQ